MSDVLLDDVLLCDVLLWPEGLPVLLLAPLAWLLLTGLGRSRSGRLSGVLGPRVAALVSDRPHRLGRVRRALFAAGLLFALVAVLQPAWGNAESDVEQRGVDILICLDVSRSMLARDHEPDRLEAARRQIRNLAKRARGDRLGLVVFAGDARLTAPLTGDLTSFVHFVDGAAPHVADRGGTDLGGALEVALNALAGRSGDHEVVLLLTDGEDMGRKGLRVAESCADRNVTVHGVGFGSQAGSKITVEGASGETFLTDSAGVEVISAMDPDSLRRIAETTGGTFQVAGVGDTALVTLYEDRILPMARKVLDVERRRDRTPRFQGPLALALLLFILDLCLTDRSRS